MRRFASLGACLAVGFFSSTVYGNPTVSASRIASPSLPSSSAVRKRSRPFSGYLSMPLAGLKPDGYQLPLAGERVQAANHR